jgi:hypothetical protein
MRFLSKDVFNFCSVRISTVPDRCAQSVFKRNKIDEGIKDKKKSYETHFIF